MDPSLVPGVLLTNINIRNVHHTTYREIPELMIGQKLDEFKPTSGDPPEYADEDQKILEERLKDLGYL
jgi:ribosomal protein S19